MVYALLTATPMHELMVNIALVFFVVAVFTWQADELSWSRPNARQRATGGQCGLGSRGRC